MPGNSIKKTKGKVRNGRKQPRRRVKANGSARTKTAMVLAQGVGRTARTAFGGDRIAGPGLACWNANLPQHLSLPRAVGPYLTVRFTKRIKSDNEFNMFAFFREVVSLQNAVLLNEAAAWTNIICASSRVPGDTIGAAGSTGFTRVNGTDELGNGTTWCPSAMTVQVMNPNALQTTTGIIYNGVAKTQFPIGGDTSRTWIDVGDEFVNFQQPRLCSAGKLALLGTTTSTYPLSMSQLSEFTRVNDFVQTQTWPARLQPAGMAPIIVYNPQAVELEYLVTTEWRVRFDLGNPACAAHRHHPVSSDSTWDMKVRDALDQGHACLDIASRVAETGAAIASSKYAQAAFGALF